MSALRVVLIAEGSGEVRPNPLRGPLSTIPVDDWGPGHVLFARAIAARSKVPRAALRFSEPLRTVRGGIARGSSLHGKTLRVLLNYQPVDRPDLIIVLVDADGDPSRKRFLDELVADMPGTKLIAVAVQEFESWLLSDGDALAAVLGVDPARTPQHPEKLARAEAKALLQAMSSAAEDPASARLSLAGAARPRFSGEEVQLLRDLSRRTQSPEALSRADQPRRAT